MRASTLAAVAWFAADVATAQTVGRIVSSAGSWDLRRSADDATHTVECSLTPRQPSRIRIDRDRLTVSGLPKNSIFNVQYIIDDKPASVPTRPSDAMQSAGAVYLDGAVLDEILGGRRLRVRILDTWHEAITEDVDLAGLADLRRTMIADCT